jgi:hypothetical protein
MMHMIQSRHGLDTTTTKRLQDMFPMPVRDSIQGYAIHKRQTLHYPDVIVWSRRAGEATQNG